MSTIVSTQVLISGNTSVKLTICEITKRYQLAVALLHSLDSSEHLFSILIKSSLRRTRYSVPLREYLVLVICVSLRSAHPILIWIGLSSVMDLLLLIVREMDGSISDTLK